MEVKKVGENLLMSRKYYHLCGSDPLRNLSFSLELVCGNDKAPIYLDEDPCDIHILLQTKMGCPIYNLTILYHLFATVLILIGLILTVCGKFT